MFGDESPDLRSSRVLRVSIFCGSISVMSLSTETAGGLAHSYRGFLIETVVYSNLIDDEYGYKALSPRSMILNSKWIDEFINFKMSNVCGFFLSRNNFSSKKDPLIIT